MSSLNDVMTRPLKGYSATVQIALHCNGTQIPVAKVGPDRIFLRTPQVISASTGEVVMHIDGRERRWHVSLRPGVEPSRIIEAQFETL